MRRQITGPARDLSRRNDTLKLVAPPGADRPVDRRMLAVRLAFHYRRAGIRRRSNRHMQRDFAQKRHAQPLRLVPRPAMAENVRTRAAMRALEITHVLDNPEHG